MTTKEQERALRARLKKVNNLQPLRAVVGDAAGNWQDPAKPGLILVRRQISNGLNPTGQWVDSPRQSMNLAPGRNVFLAYDPATITGMYISGVDGPSEVSAGVDPNVTAQPPQAPSSVQQGNFETLRVIAQNPASWIVGVKSWVIVASGTVSEFGGAAIDVTSLKPSAGNMCYIGIFIKSDYATLEAFASTPRSIADVPLNVADEQAVISQMSNGSTPIWAIPVDGSLSGIPQSAVDTGASYGFSKDWRQLVNTAASSGTIPYILLQDQKSSGTNGGTFTSGAWRTRDINTIVNDDTGGVTLNNAGAGPGIILPAGTYRVIDISAPAYFVQRHHARLYNTTDSALVLDGRSAYQATDQGISHISGQFTIAASKTLELQHQCELTTATYGFGAASGTAFTVAHEIYSSIALEKIG